MKDKLVQALKNKYSNLGFDDETFESVANLLSVLITDQAQIEAAVTAAETSLKGFQSTVDKRVNRFKNELDQLKTNPEILKIITTKNEPLVKPVETKPAEPETEIQRIIQAAISPLVNEINSLKSSKTQESLSQTLVNELKQKNIPVEFYEPAITGRTFTDSEDVQQLIAKLETSFKSFTQKVSDDKLGLEGQPFRGDVTNQTASKIKSDIERLGKFD